MHIAIVGSRNFRYLEAVRRFVHSLPIGTVIVSGGARGVDSAAELAAREVGLEVLIFLPDWDRYGKSAGFRRNKLIVDAADQVVAFWDGQSRGTLDSMEYAKECGKPVRVFQPRRKES